MQMWIEGDTAPRQYTLKTNGEPQNLTDAFVGLLGKNVDGQEIPFWTNPVTIVDPMNGLIQWAPGPDDLKAISAPYTVIWRVLFLDSTISHFPSTGPDIWQVRTLDTPMPFLTFGQLRKQVLRWLDGIQSYETGDSLDEIVKQQIQEANFQRTTEYPWWFMRAQAPVVATGANRVQLPGNMRSLRGVWSPAINDYLAHVPDRMVDVYGRTGNDRSPFVIEGNFLRFLQTPAAGTLTIHYFRVPTFMEQPDDLSDLPYPHTRLLVWDSLLDLKSYTRESEDSALWAQKQAAAEKVLYESQKDGDILGGLPSQVKPGQEMR